MDSPDLPSLHITSPLFQLLPHSQPELPWLSVFKPLENCPDLGAGIEILEKMFFWSWSS